MKSVFIEWKIKKTGEVKKTKNPIEIDAALKLVKFLNSPNSASEYRIAE